MLAHSVAAIAGYLLGSIPTGYLAGRIRGVDVRKVGSGNIGATNVFRTLGKTAGALVLLVDFLKGLLSATVVVIGAIRLSGIDASDALREQVAITAGIAAVLGHNYTCWLRFKGGKGIATSAGVLAAWTPGGLLISFATWAVTLGLTRYVSVASIAAALCLPPAVWLMGGTGRMLVITSVLSALAIYKHRSNIRRLWCGTEHRIGQNRTVSQPHSLQ